MIGLLAATTVVVKVAPPSKVAWTTVMRAFEVGTPAAKATLARSATATPGGGPALESMSEPFAGN